jgi:hypothetical protein
VEGGSAPRVRSPRDIWDQKKLGDKEREGDGPPFPLRGQPLTPVEAIEAMKAFCR